MLHLFKKTTAVLLVISMLLGVLCLPAFAVEEGDKEVIDFQYLFNNTVPDEHNELFPLHELPEEGNLDLLPPVAEGYTHVQVNSNSVSKYAIGYNYLNGVNPLDGKDYGETHFAFTDKFGTKYYTQPHAYNQFYAGNSFDGIYVFNEETGECEYLTIGNGITMNMENASLVSYHKKNPSKPIRIPVRYESVQQFVLADATTGKFLSAYCCDKVTLIQDGYSYYMENLEDADYYSDEEAAMIRSIAWNGYWGDPDEELGSLESFKASMRKSGKFTEDEVNRVTDGMALALTQYAIWSYSNKHTVAPIQLYEYYVNSKGGLSLTRSPKETADLLFKVYAYLLTLEPTPVPEKSTGNTILNKDNFMEDMVIHANALAIGHPNNMDNSHDNDAYVCDLSFKMVVAPDVQKDNLVVRVYDNAGNAILVGRIAGELQEGETQLVDDGTGRYTFHDVVLTEGTDKLNVSLDGTQELDRGIYIYTSEKRIVDGEEVSSQTLVGVAEGTHKVDVDLYGEVKFEIENVNDSVVIDYGRPVVVTPAQNTAFYGEGTLAAISANAQGYTDILFTEGLDETFGNTVEGKYGVFTLENGKIRYELNKEAHMLAMPTPDVVYYAVKVEKDTEKDTENDTADEEEIDTTIGYYYGKLTVIPATIIYYEDDFVSFTDTTLTEGTEGTGIWTTLGEQAPVIQSEDRIAISENIYGHDPMNKNYTRYSNGMAHKVTVNSVTGSRGTDENGNFTAPTASFTFTGTGFDLISLTTTDTELIQVNVWNAETGEQVFRKVVNNYYGYNYGKLPAEDGGFVVDEEGNPVYDWYVDKDADGCVWQVPVMKVEGLEYGTYNVTILVAYMTAFDHNEDQKDSFVLDSIRVYDPAKYNDEANDAYLADGEYNPTFRKLRDLILEASSFDGVDTEGELCLDGVVFVDGKDATSISMDYANPGPNNETYLAHGQSVAFKLASDIPVNNVHIGVKLAFGTSADLYLNGEKLVTVTTATDMYYVLLDASDWHQVYGTDRYETDLITLSCTTEDSVISMTNLKFTNFKNENDATAQVNAFVDSEVLEDAIAVVTELFRNNAPDAEPETEAPAAPETDAPAAPETDAPAAPETDAPAAPETDAPAENETEAPAAPETEAPAETDATATEAPAETEATEGCGSVIGMSMAALMLAMAAAVVLKKRD